MKVSVAPLMMHIVTTRGGDKPNHWVAMKLKCSIKLKWSTIDKLYRKAEVIFDCSNSNSHEILAVVSRYTSFFDDKSCNSFMQWCSRRKINFMNDAVSRKRTKNKNEKIGVRVVYVIKREFIDKVAESIAMYLPRYQEYIGNLQKKGYQVVGYARKSIGSEDEDTRIRLLQTMIERLVNRSSVKKIFVSLCSSLSEKNSARDTKELGIVKRLQNSDGNTQSK
ncbi:hypothetical protein PS15m_012010 [Mucor circinelloides]